MKFKKFLFAFAGIVFLLYWLLCGTYAYFGVSWLWIWPLFSLFCLVRFVMLQKKVRVPKFLAVLYGCAVSLFVATFLLVEGQILAAMKTEPQPGLDYVITLGAAIKNGKPTNQFIMRINRTYEYLEENPSSVAIGSGGQGPGESMPEGLCTAEVLQEYGIRPDRILVEDRSRDTEQNIRYSFELIPQGASVGVITNSFHIFRARLEARYQGHEVCGIPAKSLLPLGIHYTVREYFAVVQLYIQHLIKVM